MKSQMEHEANEVPGLIAKQLTINSHRLNELVERVKFSQPTCAMTIARGSSDHAATFAKYLLEVRAGIITTSAAPSVFTLYKKKLPLKNCLVIGISQSGASPDIVEMFQNARQEGAITVAFVNTANSPLANAAEYVIPLHAGEEKAVAATKSYLATLSALIQFVALLTQDQPLLKSLDQLPESLKVATLLDWQPVIENYIHQTSTFVIGRGFGFPVAQEAALKFKETTKIHAEAFSGAEVLHGPFALVGKDFPILFFAQQDEAFPGMLDIANRVAQISNQAFFVFPKHESVTMNARLTVLPMPAGIHPVCDPLIMIQAFYLMIAKLSFARGLSPDVVTNLSKVTKTW